MSGVLRLAALLGLGLVAVQGFAPPRVARPALALAADPALVDVPAMSKSVAQAQFFLWFFGGSGAAGIGLGRVPGLVKEWQAVQALQGVGPTAGGATLDIPSSVLGYPEDLSIADLRKVIGNKLSAEAMVLKGPKDAYVAQRGYLTFPAFQAANKGANPLAVRAVFDVFVSGVAAPAEAQAKLDAFKADTSEGLDAFKAELIAARAKGSSALLALFGILAFTAKVCIDSAAIAFF